MDKNTDYDFDLCIFLPVTPPPYSDVTDDVAATCHFVSTILAADWYLVCILPKMPKMAPVNIRVSPLGILLICLCIVGILFYTWGGKSYNFYFFDKSPSIPQSDSASVSLRDLLSASMDLAEKGGNRVREIREMKKKELGVSAHTTHETHSLLQCCMPFC